MHVWWIVTLVVAGCLAIGAWYLLSRLVVNIQVGPVPIRSE